MVPAAPNREREVANWNFFLDLPEVDRTQISLGSIKNAQLMIPLFEFSGACAGCGETPYIKLATQRIWMSWARAAPSPRRLPSSVGSIWSSVAAIRPTTVDKLLENQVM